MTELFHEFCDCEWDGRDGEREGVRRRDDGVVRLTEQDAVAQDEPRHLFYRHYGH